ncbi:hypothetical protein K450DRAFT_214495 [Umbelopsis ramanniana AG]|uniref:Triacylglycerol lipase n=1 Tax=Umbelopsis ramanniana AG TaxID=1314678 RepID=A0AAD5E5X2_UMBRA|nr:uncharacterized protein K450DRAFT_214495 [Umbelopsis ramanniana AG]KAI8576220.1 hypothetical protein K450DRAFT_214495 [Umbelopsis ramanniana AG]
MLLFFLIVVVPCTLGLQVANISLCPQLAKRTNPPLGAYDLRPDDFTMIMALGDSVSAGFGIGGIQGQFLSDNSLQEYRGSSFSIGGDPNATTVANMVRYYSTNLVGPSVGTNLITLCFRKLGANDYFNAAQSGAHSSDLDHELDYLIPTVQQYAGLNQSGWKMLNVFIGSNDLCAICEGGYRSPTEYGQNILAALERFRSSMSNVFVNLSKNLGLIHVEDIYQLTMNSSYCKPFQNNAFVVHDYECPCAHSMANQTAMAANVEFYNQALKSVYSTYAAQNFPTFGVAYQPLPVNIMSFPIEAISNIDCFHPALMAHEWLAKMIWNMMFVPQSQKPSTLTFNMAATTYCPTESDRLQIF